MLWIFLAQRMMQLRIKCSTLRRAVSVWCFATIINLSRVIMMCDVCLVYLGLWLRDDRARIANNCTFYFISENQSIVWADAGRHPERTLRVLVPVRRSPTFPTHSCPNADTMTVTYTAQVATCRGFGCFLKLLFRWVVSNGYCNVFRIKFFAKWFAQT